MVPHDQAVVDPVADAWADRLDLIARFLLAVVITAMVLIAAGLYGARAGEDWGGPVALVGTASLLITLAVAIPFGRKAKAARAEVGHPVPPSLASLVHGAHLAYELLDGLADTARVPWYRWHQRRRARREVRQDWGFLLHALAAAERARRRGDDDGYARHREKASARAMALVGLAHHLTSSDGDGPSAK
ncbi:hypothetical protein [Amycolatopsis sp. CA-230715]|uniref:hypothetical protein n=1 Tax=Amycolatopsis sp. CA-230715 TaxID=2745196 RepID=UPI001C01F49B|nr:hypothetical protein [Amycolatopsis sp. CA-230715]QWF84776.1 hypothetical protein HUW46_08228 [Amycolatopsis sp. CA-230715]